MAAARVYGTAAPFKAYAILGDDIVIGDSRVASEYSSILSDLQVTISSQKSFISDSGACEFAKKYYVRGCSVDLSPISIKALHACNSVIGLLMLRDRYNIQNIATLCRKGVLVIALSDQFTTVVLVNGNVLLLAFANLAVGKVYLWSSGLEEVILSILTSGV